MSRILFLIGFLVLTRVPLLAETVYVPADGTHQVATWLADWHDASRDRKIPVKIYYPADAGGPACPVILFSHGLGATRETYAYLGKYWAAHGYVSVHVQHPGSDAEVIAGTNRPLVKLRKLKTAANDPENFPNRPLDIEFALDELGRLQGDPAFPLHGRMDLEHVAAAGHSFGAYSVLALAGQAIGPDDSVAYYGPDPRFLAGLAMSSDAALTTNLDDAYDRIWMPIFHLTGTKDQLGNGHLAGDGAIIGNTTAAERRVAYDHTRHAPAWLLILQGGDHRLFSGLPRTRGNDEHDEAYRHLVSVASTAFWDAMLRGDPAAQHWLDEGGFAALLGDSGTFEHKRP